MILSIINMFSLIILITVLLYIVLQYLNIKSDLKKMNTVIPKNVYNVHDVYKYIQPIVSHVSMPIPKQVPTN